MQRTKDVRTGVTCSWLDKSQQLKSFFNHPHPTRKKYCQCWCTMSSSEATVHMWTSNWLKATQGVLGDKQERTRRNRNDLLSFIWMNFTCFCWGFTSLSEIYFIVIRPFAPYPFQLEFPTEKLRTGGDYPGQECSLKVTKLQTKTPISVYSSLNNNNIKSSIEQVSVSSR